MISILEAVSLDPIPCMRPVQENIIVAWAGRDSSPLGCLHLPYWSKKPLDGNGQRMKLSVTVATMAAAVEFAVLHAATIALVSGQNPSCSNFDLSRWGLLNFVAAPQGSSSMPADSEMRDRSRSPQPKGCSKSSKPKGSDKEPKGSGKGQSHHGRSGLEPSVIKLLRAWYAKDWGTVGSTCDSIYWSRKNIRDQVG